MTALHKWFFCAVCCLGCSIVCFAAESSIPVLTAAEKLKADVSWNPLTEAITFSHGDKVVQCRIGQPLVFFNKKESLIMEAPILQQGIPQLPLSLFYHIEHFFNRTEAKSHFRVGAILIDPGHGGTDPGTIGSYMENGEKVVIYEKNIALKVSLDLYQQLKKAYPDKKILLTRSDDTYPTPEQRVEQANNVPLQKDEAIIFVSIHANAYPYTSRPYGFEVWYLPSDYRRDVVDRASVSEELHPILNSMLEEEFTTESVLLAKNILDGMEEKIGKESKNRGIKEEKWYVVRNAKMPSVLVELGFVTNPEEAKRLNTPEYLHRCAAGIYNGIAAFVSRFEGS